MNLGFYGSHFQNNALILPSKNCIVSLVETPFLVITLSEIEIVSFERVDNKIKNFDMATKTDPLFVIAYYYRGVASEEKGDSQ